MNNPLYQAMMKNPMDELMQKVNQLKNSMGGDPNEHIQKLLNSGKKTQADYNRAMQQAQQLQRLFGRK